MKKLCSILLILFCVVFGFAGCAKIENFVKILPSGEIQIGLNINIDRAEIDAAHQQSSTAENTTPNSTEFLTIIYTLMNNQKTYVENVFNKVAENERPKYAILITYNDVPFSVGLTNVASNIQFTLSYASYEEYLKGQELLKAASGNTDDSENTGENYWTKSLFKYTHVTKNDSYFKEFLDDNTNGSILNIFSNMYPTFNAETDVTYVQLLATQDKKMHSNATSTYKQNGIYYHVWKLDGAQAKTPNVITEYYVYPNTQGWFLLTLILTAIFALFYVLFIFYKKPLKDKSKKQK